MNRRFLAVLSAAAVLSAGGIVAVSNAVSAETVDSVCASSGPGSGSWVINANADVPDGVVISSVTLDQDGATVTEGIDTRQVQVQYVGDALSGTATFSNGATDSFSAQGDCTYTTPLCTPRLIHGDPPMVIGSVTGPGSGTVTGETWDSHPNRDTTTQLNETVTIVAVPAGGGEPVVILDSTVDLADRVLESPRLPFSAPIVLGDDTYTIEVRHNGGPATNSVCVTANVEFVPDDTTTTTSTTTTTLVETTTTTLPDTFAFGAATTVCMAEVPTIRITFLNRFPELAGQSGTLTMRDINGNVVSTQSLVYAPGTMVDLLYPGTSVNADGSIDDVPGWILNDDGFWLRDPSDEFLREGINLSYTVNPTATALVTYPPESSTCANPDGPFPPGVTTLPGQLPPAR